MPAPTLTPCPGCGNYLFTPASIDRHNLRVALDGERSYGLALGRTQKTYEIPRISRVA